MRKVKKRRLPGDDYIPPERDFDTYEEELRQPLNITQ
jgi:hypothetical protein